MANPNWPGPDRRRSNWRIDKTINVWQVLTVLGVAATGIQMWDKQAERIGQLEHQMIVQAERDRAQDQTHDQQYRRLESYVDEVRSDIKTLLARR